MRAALFDGTDALTTVELPAGLERSPKPIAVDVHWPAPEGQPNSHRLSFHCVRISVLHPDKSVGYTYIACCADPETAQVVRTVLVDGAHIPGVPPQHMPEFRRKFRALMKTAG